jgi:hypothetical protein
MQKDPDAKTPLARSDMARKAHKEGASNQMQPDAIEAMLGARLILHVPRHYLIAATVLMALVMMGRAVRSE